MVSIGIDIGTTTICACVLDANTGVVLKTWNKQHAFLPSHSPWAKVQNVEEIESTVNSFLTEITDVYPEICCLGLTGQMHGILYLDDVGTPVSPLITWQDERGNQFVPDQTITYSQQLSQMTHYPCATGFGSVTHYYNVSNHLVPDRATVFCTIQDYLMMKLGRLKHPLTHPSDGVSIGLYDLKTNQFDQAAIRTAGMDPSFFPAVSQNATAQTAFGFPVAVAIGDNQACFHGSVRNPEESLLVNVGTGSQISCWTDTYHLNTNIEMRPYVDGGYLLSGSSLCGGRAYALLEQFFRTVLKQAKHPVDHAYDIMNQFLSADCNFSNPLLVETTFCGSRMDPSLRGSIRGIGIDNFTPSHLTYAFLQGCVNELADFYAKMKSIIAHTPKYLIGSGNGLRKNTVLQNLFARTFQMDLLIPAHMEEASYGAALFAMICTMPEHSPQRIRNLIRYQY